MGHVFYPYTECRSVSRPWSRQSSMPTAWVLGTPTSKSNMSGTSGHDSFTPLPHPLNIARIGWTDVTTHCIHMEIKPMWIWIFLMFHSSNFGCESYIFSVRFSQCGSRPSISANDGIANSRSGEVLVGGGIQNAIPLLRAAVTPCISWWLADPSKKLPKHAKTTCLGVWHIE